MSRRFFNFIFIAFLALLPLQTVWLWREPVIDGSKWQYGTIGIYGTDILFVLAVVFYVAPHLMRGPGLVFSGSRIKSGMTSMLLLFFIVWSGLSILWADDKILAGYFFIKLLLAFGVFFLAWSLDIFQNRKMVVAVLVVAIAESILGMWQFFSQSSFASTLFGMNGYEPWRAGVSVLKNESGRWLRAYGTFPHPNMYGAYLGVMFSGVIGYTVFFAKKFIVPVFISLVLLLGFIVSFSRTAWLGVVLSLSVLAVKIIWQGNTEQKQNFKKISLVIGMATVVFVGVLHETVFPRFDTVTIQKETSIIDRSMLARQAMEIIREHPIVGAGAGNYTLAVMHTHLEIPVWEVQPVHNVFLLVFAELGAIGVFLFISFLVSVFAQGFRSLFLQNKKENAIFFVALLSLVSSLFLDHFLWDSHFGLLFFFLLSGLSVKRF